MKISLNFSNFLLIIYYPAVASLVYIEFFADNVKRGFFCGDQSISFNRQQDTISIKAVVISGLTPLLFVRCLLMTLFFAKFIFYDI